MKSTTVKQRRRYRVKDQSLLCDICGRHFQRPQALFAHKRMLHLVRDKTIPDPEVRVEQVSAKDTIKNLEDEVAQLKLEEEKRKLVAALPTTRNEPADLMAQLGLGSFDSEVKAQAQRRAMSLGDSAQGQAQSWLDKLLSAPGGVQTAVDALKGVLGVGRNEGNGLGILRELGIDLKTLWERSQSPKGDSSFKVGGISLDGVSLTPEVWSSIIAFKQSEDNLSYQKAKDTALADGLQGVIKIVTESGILNRLGGGIAKGAFEKRGAGREVIADPGVEGIFNCPECGFENRLPADIGLGVEIHCQSPDCKQTWITEYPQVRQPKPKSAKKQVKVNPPVVEETACPGCGQLLNLDGRSIGEVVRCSVCGDELTVQSSDLAVPAENPLTESEKLQGKFLRK